MSLLGKLQQFAKDLVREVAPIDPSVFEDEIASRTLWTPLSPGGASFRTHKLTEVEPDGLEFSRTAGLYVFGGLFLVVGLAIGIAGALKQQWFGLLGVAFVLGALAILWPRKLVFDGQSRTFTGRGRSVSFSAIHALQIVKEYVRSDKQSFWSYEINLVLKDAERVHLVDHADLPSIRADAARVSVVLGCKLWDATAQDDPLHRK